MHHQQGFTLIELLTAITIITILALITLSGLNTFSQHNTSRLVLNKVFHMLEYARDQAEVLRKPISVAKDTEWSNSQLTFVDLTRSGKLSESAQLIARNHTLLYGGSLHMQSYPAIRDFVSFMPYQDDDTDNAVFWYCEQHASLPVWAIFINQQAVIAIIYPDKRGNIHDEQGRVLHC